MRDACVLVSKEGGSVVNFFIGKSKVFVQTSRSCFTWHLTSLCTLSSSQHFSAMLLPLCFRLFKSTHRWQLPPAGGHSLKRGSAPWPVSYSFIWFFYLSCLPYFSFLKPTCKLIAEMALQGSINPVLCSLNSRRTHRIRDPVGTRYIRSE